MVIRQVVDIGYEAVWSNKGGATQIYHVDLLKAWREAENTSVLRPGEGES